MLPRLGAVLFVAYVSASVTVTEPSDVIDPDDWTDDNALKAVFDIEPLLYQAYPIVGAYQYDNESANISRQYLTVDANDTSVLVIANSSEVVVANTVVTKFGYGTNIFQESFFGLNAAVNVANDSRASFSDINITVHNGAAGIFAYGSGTVVEVANAWLYSSGPTSHGLYAAGNATIHARNVHAYTGGNRCSAFSGDADAGYVYVTNAVAHTGGIGSAICYALGVCDMTNVVGNASQSPVTFSDGPQTSIWRNSELTAGLLGGAVLFSSSTRKANASVSFDHSKLTVMGEDMPAFWVGNLIATANIIASDIDNSASGILAVANFSQVTQDFNYFADYESNNDLSPAELTINVEASAVAGSLIAYNESSIAINLTDYSSWAGDTRVGFGNAYFGVSLDKSSNWTLTANTILLNFTDADPSLGNIASAGFNITYSADAEANIAWNGKILELPGGGYLTPA